MKKLSKNQIIYLLIGVIVVLVISIIVILFLLQPRNEFQLKNQSSINETNEQNRNETTKKEETKEPDKNENNSTVEVETPIQENSPSESHTTQQPEIKPTPTPSPTPENNIQNSQNKQPETTKNEEDVIAYFETENQSLDNQNDSSFKEKAKNTFTTIIDFIFYDKEIKGYTFKELTTSAKLKIIEIALKIDSKIESYIPNYKETLEEKYQNIKGKLAYAYLEFTSYLCEAVGEDTCNQAKEDFESMKKSFGFTWELIKELAKSGADKIKEFYETTFKE